MFNETFLWQFCWDEFFEWMLWKLFPTSKDPLFSHFSRFLCLKVSIEKQFHQITECMNKLLGWIIFRRQLTKHKRNKRNTQHKKKLNKTVHSTVQSAHLITSKRRIVHSWGLGTGDLLQTFNKIMIIVSFRIGGLLLQTTQLHIHFKCALLLIIAKRYF